MKNVTGYTVLLLITALWFACTAPPPEEAAEEETVEAQPEVTFEHEPNVLHISVGGDHFADYVYSDPEISRPYFAHVRTPEGIQVTRNRPPDPETDLTDHALLHPGIWTSYGDINGNDYWRLKAPMEHEMFIESPEGSPGQGSFAVRNYFLTEEGTDRIGVEEVYYTIVVQPQGYLLISESRYAPYGDTEQLVFGDQEEFGFGIRVHSQIAEQFGGVITDSEGRQGAEAIWSKQADWIDYSGELDGKWVGLTILVDPDNFRKAWFHARDYGLIVANAFGREAMQAGEKSEVIVGPDEELTLRYGLLIHSSDSRDAVDQDQAYQSFLEVIGSEQ